MMEVPAYLVFNDTLGDLKFAVFLAIAISVTILSYISRSPDSKTFCTTHMRMGPRMGF
jgi:hypothetical protein